MRWVFYGLLVINIVFFAWQNFGGDSREPIIAGGASAGDGVVSIKLLSELNKAGNPGLERRSDKQKCDVYGPFFSEVDSRLFLRSAGKTGLSGVSEEELVRLEPYFGLYVAPQGSVKKTRALINRLRGYQLNAELVLNGKLRHGISLGDFESRDDVARLQQKLSVYSIELKVLEKSRDYRQFWVYLEPGSEALLTEELRSELIVKFPDIFHQQKNCKLVASGE